MIKKKKSDKELDDNKNNSIEKDDEGLYQTEDAPPNHPDNTSGNMKILME